MLGQQVVNGLTLGCLYALMALGYSMVYGLLRLLNFAHGEVMMVGAFAGWAALKLGAERLPGPLAVAVALAAAAASSGLLGLAVERCAYRPLRRAGRLVPLISVLGASVAIRNAVALLTGGRSKALPTAALLGNARLRVLGAEVSPVRLLVALTTGLLLLGLDYLARRTRLGREIRAVAEDREAAELTGIDVSRVVTATFALGSCLAGVAGLLAGMYYTQIDFYMGFSLGLKAFTAAVLGGIGSMGGAVLGGLAMGLAESLGVQVVGPVYKDLWAFGLLILALVARPQGLVRTRPGRSA